ncbi:hypothetical protein POPTR_001G041800v4 [Populus trichocarpa]|uniref:TRF2/HOY1 PH-like domain-containing protein n=1 Tax=Populus trichocarpa TaxID=3694 RepID=B9GLP3_POPTR|nr:uncharacterized protein LOC7476451 isoform X1 [Populus trichocarpa]KAI5600638.1 hypothetical protein BDE02_01G038600 [Populus trichocarpa]KAI5600639.1 hypothetical protein BDE02_01G038600 [Populus trichocarpa]KAI5600645.1 hypothetical protein BDE02_01G038600 [Populus trichocarpa]KAI5600646.1 hypothetical protein BDE02_01G038600 [Populus trichocarpa]RQO84391.1 hypothetical protein POPTR_001G041800v4 [Populus trichocarpa]|eukprot:XP_002299157.1 uncharacterized protein LOC7476451 isoform X1 [Populus trichocarpa]
MVQSMSSLSRKASVKLEADDSLEDQLSPLHKRSKLDPCLQVIIPDAVLYNPLQEPSPIGLTLKKSPSFLDLIQMKLSQQNTSNTMLSKKPSSAAADKLKASNFTASLLKIGSWECKSRYEGDLVAKCYFAKHKLVWEVLDGGLKNKIEIQWSDIVAIKANFPDDGPETLDVVLARQPLFFRETNPQPRKHTLWQATSDFTGGQASTHRRHFLQFQQGFMGKHYEKLIQCDPRLSFLSQQLEIILESPYFAQRVSAFSDLHESGKGLDSEVEDRTAVFALQEAGPPSGVLSSSLNNECQGLTCQSPENISQQTSSTTLVMETHAFEETRSNRTGEQQLPSNCDQIKVPGLHPSISMSDLVNHIGHCISEQMTSGNSILSGGDIKSSDILDEITQYLLGDSQVMSASDEQSVVSTVNSLCCLLQKDPATARDLQAKSLSDLDVDHDRRINETNSTASACQSKFIESFPAPEGEASNVSICKQAPAMSRKDSVGELLLNLPSIASLPQFLFNI